MSMMVPDISAPGVHSSPLAFFAFHTDDYTVFSNFLTAVYAPPYYPRLGLLPRLFRPAAINDHDDVRFKISVKGTNVKFSKCQIKTAETTHRLREQHCCFVF
jgi:hypothetical protein